jgi:protein-tyrosine phosphatase
MTDAISRRPRPLHDLGGLATTGGLAVRRDLVLRTVEQRPLRQPDFPGMAALGVRTVIDLRAVRRPGELGTSEPPPSARAGVLHVPVVGQASGSEPTPGGAALAIAVHLLASPALRPAVFHTSSAGSGTAYFAALLLELLGVPRDRILDHATSPEERGVICRALGATSEDPAGYLEARGAHPQAFTALRADLVAPAASACFAEVV